VLLLTALLLQVRVSEPALTFTERAAMTMDSISALAWRDGLEPGACVKEWEILQDTIHIKAIIPGDVVNRAPKSVQWNGKVCGDSLPSIHGHLLGIGAMTRPSPMDWMLASQPHIKAPFHLVLLIGVYGHSHKVLVYAHK
jgi:hypothetical protein